MEKKIELLLKYETCQNKPIVTRWFMGIKTTIMFDSGAEVPVWGSGVDAFLKIFPNAKKLTNKVLLGGFGKTTEEFQNEYTEDSFNDSNIFVPVYRVPKFVLVGDEIQGRTEFERSLTWSTLPVAVTDRQGFGADLILPAAMFKGMFIGFKQTDTYVSTSDNYVRIFSSKPNKYIRLRLQDFKGHLLMASIYATDSISPLHKEQSSSTDESHAF